MGHGITIEEEQTSLKAPVYSDAACQIVIGKAPINLLKDPKSAVNKPILVNNFAEAVSNIGYCTDFENYELCQSIYLSFQVFNVAPIVFINVLDPDNPEHIEEVQENSYEVTNKQAFINDSGVLLDTITVKKTEGATTYNKDVDYMASFDDNGKVVINIMPEGGAKSETSLKISYEKLKPSGVTADDIIGGYDDETNTYKGIEAVEQVFPKLGKVGGMLIAPGYSQDPNVMNALKAKSKNINGIFKVINICDVDTNSCKTYQSCVDWKNQNSYTDKSTYLGFPMVKIGDYKMYASAHMSAGLAQTIADDDEGVPYISPSNKDAGITGCCLADGTEVYLSQVQANFLNDNGIFTYINWQGWKTWGNEMACYPNNSDPKDRFISSRNIFNWWANTFILTHFPEIDNPMSRKNLDRIIDVENIRANGFTSNEKIAGAKMIVQESDNPETNLIGGKIVLRQSLTPYPPMSEIVNKLEYDVATLQKALFGNN